MCQNFGFQVKIGQNSGCTGKILVFQFKLVSCKVKICQSFSFQVNSNSIMPYSSESIEFQFGIDGYLLESNSLTLAIDKCLR